MRLKEHIILIGMPGCGKTSFGRDIAKQLGVELYDTDEFLEKMQGKSIPDIFQEEGEDRFRKYETESLRAVLKKGPAVIATGGGIVKLPENRELMKNGGTVVFIDRPLDNIFSDVDTESRPLLSQNKERLQSLYEERYDLFVETADLRVVNDRCYEEVLEEIVETVKDIVEGAE
ncbi:shikimate kinase [Andreesenia angusta]|uniref:Shikimate kinase n=1 Tax=Andreesenia angusta TaxID=39480 RepID=A0A1S1V578_9FIRM|nr:shikimate kinase [Andreesenia angusta]